MDGTKAMKRSSATTRRLLSTFIAMARAVLCCAVLCVYVVVPGLIILITHVFSYSDSLAPYNVMTEMAMIRDTLTSQI